MVLLSRERVSRLLVPKRFAMPQGLRRHVRSLRNYRRVHNNSVQQPDNLATIMLHRKKPLLSCGIWINGTYFISLTNHAIRFRHNVVIVSNKETIQIQTEVEVKEIK